MDGPITLDGGSTQLLAGFFLGYAAILAVPGQNMLAIGGVAALRGLRGAAPLCLGVALGAGVLSATLLLCAAVADLGAGWSVAGRLAGAALLAVVAASILRSPPPPRGAEAAPARGAEPARLGRDLAAFAAGFCTAVANPLTTAFFAAQFLGPLGAAREAAAAAPVGVAAMAGGFFLAVAALLSRPAARRLALRWHRPARLLAGAVLLLCATSLLRAALQV